MGRVREICGEWDIVSISLPFVTGVAIGTLFPSSVWPLSFILADSLLILSATLLVSIGFNGKSRPAISSCFLLLGCFCILSCENTVLQENRGFLAGIASRKMSGLQSIIKSIDFRYERCAALVSALLTGDKTALTAVEVSAFRDSGASHILALSGLHLGVIYQVIRKVFSLAGNSRAVRLSSAFCIAASGLFYVIMTGASASIVRAYIFILLNEAGRIEPQRKRNGICTLMAALTIQLAIKPGSISSAAFQLSYLAISGLIVLSPYLQSWYPGKGVFKKIWDIAAASISCQLFTAPVAFFHFGTFPRHFLITNLIALPLSEAIIVLAVVVLSLEAAGMPIPILEDACSIAAEALMYSMEIISKM